MPGLRIKGSISNGLKIIGLNKKNENILKNTYVKIKGIKTIGDTKIENIWN